MTYNRTNRLDDDAEVLDPVQFSHALRRPCMSESQGIGVSRCSDYTSIGSSACCLYFGGHRLAAKRALIHSTARSSQPRYGTAYT
ncbi:hypothetical protein TNCV_4903531 [Trichonephila clavipes]|uniref:Uncharacterized protein n=1 Tax=Trichonephila clavipes TaxID=2585209 RepID=A0A8X6S7F9_TRICX|nr:hypothetical protein TNCV_4903531 [Trichonephila clavipes]